jgi:hypothetical protein
VRRGGRRRRRLLRLDVDDHGESGGTSLNRGTDTYCSDVKLELLHSVCAQDAAIAPTVSHLQFLRLTHMQCDLHQAGAGLSGRASGRAAGRRKKRRAPEISTKPRCGGSSHQDDEMRHGAAGREAGLCVGTDAGQAAGQRSHAPRMTQTYGRSSSGGRRKHRFVCTSAGNARFACVGG